MKKLLWLIVIAAFASVLRLWQLGAVPPSPDWDEAALGYNAYSILKTGRDEYGNWFPLTIRSFDDYKPPLYVYLTIPAVAAFGLETWSVRLPSAVLGILAVIGTYWLVSLGLNLINFKELQKLGIQTRFIDVLPFISSLLLAVSPWHIQFSRIAFEANTGVTLIVWGAVFFLKSRSDKKFLFLSSGLLSLSFYAYHSLRVFTPLLVLLLTCVFFKELVNKSQIKHTLISILIGALVVAPLLPVIFDQSALLRLRGTSAFADQTGLLARSVQKLERARENNWPWSELFDNRRIVYLQTFFQGYISHYSLKWLFLTGDNPRHHAPDMGLLYIWELPFFLIGLLTLACIRGKFRALILGWYLIAPVAAAPTTELPHAIRTLVFLPSLQIITGLGLLQGLSWISRINRVIRVVIIVALGVVISFNFAYYLDAYFVHMNHEFSEYWQYGYQEAVAYAESHKDKYQKIVVSTSLEQPHMFFLFFTKYDPIRYLRSGGTRSGSFAEVENKFDKYEFRKINWTAEVRDGTILYVGPLGELPHGNNANIRFLDGKSAIEMADRE